jgi:hypothetical protein
MPARRLRISPRVVTRAMSRHNAKGKIDRTICKATIDITILNLTPGDATQLTGLAVSPLCCARPVPGCPGERGHLGG